MVTATNKGLTRASRCVQNVAISSNSTYCVNRVTFSMGCNLAAAFSGIFVSDDLSSDVAVDDSSLLRLGTGQQHATWTLLQ